MDTKSGYQVKDLHKEDGKLELRLNGKIYRGVIDTGVVPYATKGTSCVRHMRLGVELKRTPQQKTASGENSIKMPCWALVVCFALPYT